MNQSRYVLEDEVPFHEDKLTKIKADMRAQGEEKSIAFSQGETFHDNPAGEQVEMEQKMSSGQYMEIKGLIDNSKRLTFDALQNTPEDVVSIGKVVVILIDDEEEKTFMIGGSHTPIEGRVSYEAPLARAIMGREEGDEVDFHLHGKTKTIEIISVSRGSSEA